MLMSAKMTAMIVTGMELVQTPLDPLNVFATMDTLETDAIVRVEYNFKLLLPLWQKVQNFLQNSGFAKVAKVERNKQTNRQIHTRVIMFVYFGNKFFFCGGPPLNLLYTIFHDFVYLLLTNGTPFTYLA